MNDDVFIELFRSFLYFQAARQQLESVIPKLHKIADLQEELRECVSPQDIKTSNQQVWLLKQQQADLDHRSVKIPIN